MSKRANNQGSIFEDKIRNKYRAQVTTPSGKTIAKRFDTKPEAQNWLNEQLVTISRGQFIEPSSITLGEWLLEWLELYSKDNVRQRTYERYLSLSKHCQPIAGIKLQALRPSHFQHLYKNMSAYAGETRKKVHNLLGAALKQAVFDRIIQFNPMEGVTSPKVVREEIETFKHEELQFILATAKNHRWYPSLLLAVTTGMRLGEVLGLRWQDIDFNENCVYVRQTLQHASTGIIFEEPKSKASKRKITIPKETIEALKQHKKIALERKLKLNISSELCFTADNGSPIQPKNYQRWWTKLQKDASQESDQTHKNFHTLRHTHATWLLASGEAIVEVSRRLGHAKPSVTLDVYGHAIPAHDKKIADKISSLYGLK